MAQMELKRTIHELRRAATERQAAEAALRKSEERFQKFMNSGPAVAYIKDASGRFVYVNEPTARRFQIPAGDWIGKTGRGSSRPGRAPTRGRARPDRAQRRADGGGRRSRPDARTAARYWQSYKFLLHDGDRPEAGRRLVLRHHRAQGRRAGARTAGQRTARGVGGGQDASGFLPICASCKNIRDDAGYWQQIETLPERARRRGVHPRHLPGLRGEAVSRVRRSSSGTGKRTETSTPERPRAKSAKPQWKNRGRRKRQAFFRSASAYLRSPAPLLPLCGLCARPFDAMIAMTADTIAAVATPFGEGAIAMLRVSGPDALEIAGRVCRRRGRTGESSAPAVAPRDGCTRPTDRALDDVLVSVHRAPASYTGEDVVEITCHGGILVTRRVLEALLAAGARAAEPGEFTQRAFLNGKMDLTQAEAVMDLIRAQTDLALRAASRTTRRPPRASASTRLREDLLSLVAHVEAYIDFPDEDIDPDTGAALLARFDAAARGARRPAGHRRAGAHPARGRADGHLRRAERRQVQPAQRAGRPRTRHRQRDRPAPRATPSRSSSTCAACRCA